MSNAAPRQTGPSDLVAARADGPNGRDQLAPIIAKLQPVVAEQLAGQNIATLPRQSLAIRIGEITFAELERYDYDLNLVQRRALVSELVDRLTSDSATAAEPSLTYPPVPYQPPGGDRSAEPPPQPPQQGLMAQSAAISAPARFTRAAGGGHRDGGASCAPPGPSPLHGPPRAADGNGAGVNRTSIEDAKRRIQATVMDRIDVAAAARLDRDELQRQIGELVSEILKEFKIRLNQREHMTVVELILDDMLGLGPLEPLLADETVTDIMVNGPSQVYVERGGKLSLTDVKFRDNAHVVNIATRIVSQVGRRVDETTPLCDARLMDGSRVNIIIPPLAIDGPSISIRKFAKKGITLDLMVRQRNLSEPMATVLKVAARSRLNILISGGTGSGKTTLLNAMSQMIDPGERIVTIEDAAELQLQQPHVVRLETRPANLEGDGEITMRDLLKNALRMRPDRIIMGEVRGAEAVDMLQAMNTGHEGSMSTIHANRPREALTRLENMVGMAGINLPAKAVRTQIAAAVDMIVQVSRMRDGMRRITHVVEVVGMEGDVITTQELFTFQFEGEDPDGRLRGTFKSSGLRPHFMPKAAYFGLDRTLLEAMA